MRDAIPSYTDEEGGGMGATYISAIPLPPPPSPLPPPPVWLHPSAQMIRQQN